MLILFDYDGVIVASFDLLLDYCIQAHEAIGIGRTPTARDFQTIENLSFDSLGRLIGIPDAKITEYSAIIFELQKKRWAPPFYPNIDNIFSSLAEHHTLGIITASGTEAVSQTLADSGIMQSINIVLGGENGQSKAERITSVREKYQTEPFSTFMVGDAISDIRQGKLAGVKTIGVSWGFQDRALLANEHPDFLIDQPIQLLEVMNTAQSDQ